MSNSGLSCGTQYSYTVASFGGGGMSSQSSAATATTYSCYSAPSISYVAPISQTELEIAWSGDGPVDHYKLNGTPYEGTATSYNLTGLSCGTEYGFTVTACYNATCTVSLTSGATPVFGTTDACTPGTPSINSVSTTNINSIDLTWQFDEMPESSSMGLEIYRSDGEFLESGSFDLYEVPPYTQNVYMHETCVPSGQGVYARAYITSHGRKYYSGYTGTASVPRTCETTAPTISFSPSSISCDASSVSVTPTASDASGIASTEYCWTSASSCAPSLSFTNGNSISISSEGDWNLCVKATDNYANTATQCSGYYSIDTTAPSPNPPTVSASASGRDSVSVTLSPANDFGCGGSAASPYGISINGSSYTYYSSVPQTISNLTCGTDYTIYGKLRDGIGNETSVGTALVTTASCVNSPSAVSTTTVIEDPGRPQLTTSFTTIGATGYLIYTLDKSTGAYTFRADISDGSATITSLKCPAVYTVITIPYNTDSSLLGTVDSSCSELNSIDSLRSIDKKCGSKTISTSTVNYCTRGFFGD